MVHADKSLAHSNGSPHALTSKEKGTWQQEKDGHVRAGEWSRGWNKKRGVPAKNIYMSIKSRIIKKTYTNIH